MSSDVSTGRFRITRGGGPSPIAAALACVSSAATVVFFAGFVIVVVSHDHATLVAALSLGTLAFAILVLASVALSARSIADGIGA